MNAARVAHKQTARAGAQRAEAKGRTVGRGAGSWVTDLAELRQSLLLCWSCDARWNSSAPKYGYGLHRRWMKQYGGVIGKCDGCREGGPNRRFYVHESFFGKV